MARKKTIPHPELKAVNDNAAAIDIGSTMHMAAVNPEQTSVARLTDAVTEAGARVFAVVDFAQGNASVGAELRPTTVVIFGSPQIGATALQAGQTLALYLPLRILFFEDAFGQTWLTYDDPAHVAPTHGVPAENPAVQKMAAALARFATIAAGG